MARFARKAKTEPMLRLERPSQAGSQSTAHVINAIFGEQLSSRPLDAQSVRNLTISRRGDAAYHDSYVANLERVRACVVMVPSYWGEGLGRGTVLISTHRFFLTIARAFLLSLS